MHFLETYALNSGLKIDKPYIFQKYYPIPCDNFIAFSHDNYEHYQDVIDIIKPYLKDTEILYIKKKQGEEFHECKEVTELDYNQIAYLIGKSKLFFGEPTLYSDLAAHYDVPTVTLYSKAYPQNVRPYWNRKNNHEITAESQKEKPCFNSEESYKIVNTIRPEKIAKDILSALDMKCDYNYKTIYMGEFYQSNNIITEVVPDKNPPVLMHHSNCAVRMDLKFDENYLKKILNLRSMQIWTNNPINENILQGYSSRIQKIFYIIPEHDSPDFVRTLKKLSIDTTLVSFLSEEKLNAKKLSYADYDPIIDLGSYKLDIDGYPINNLYYSSCKAIYEGGLYYPSEYARENMMAVKDPFEICEYHDNDILSKDLPYFKILLKQG
jgi:hypothetical protein